ncbi:S8 family serine peptidase [Methylophaga sp.]|uniref:S8 family serine peptidase n=1 Tax=Methylophaga sp. TaxID=2024840 RepID=UPI003F695689
MAMQLRIHLPFLIIFFLTALLNTALTQPRADTDVRSVTKRLQTDTLKWLSGDKLSLFDATDRGCVLPGEVLPLKGQNLMALTDYHLVFRAKRKFVPLKQLSISKHQVLIQIPRDTSLKRGERYSVMLLTNNGANVSKKTGIHLQLCPDVYERRLLPVREAHENGEILILANSGITDQVIKEGAKLGYILLRRHQLDSINQTLMVLGGSDQNLPKTIKKLNATFADAKVDLNQHYYINEQNPLLHADRQIQWQPETSCYPIKANHVVVGLLDGDIDQSHPALSSKNIKTHNFLPPNQIAAQEHATAIAVLLIGNDPRQNAQGLVPFIDLKAAGVVRKQAQENAVATAESIARAMDWFINENVQLINVSLTSSHANKVSDFIFAESINKGLIIFAAAGNDSQKLSLTYPAALPGVIAITALDTEGKTLSTANQGEYIDFAAPGGGSWTAQGKHQGRYYSGASFAVPHAISIAALYLGQQNDLTQDRLFESMQFNAVDLGSPGYDTHYGWGQLLLNQQMCHH